MRPAAVFPIHDPDGRLLVRLPGLLPDLKAAFEAAFVLPSPQTRAAQPEAMRLLEADPFFQSFTLGGDPPVGDQFAFLYRRAIQASPGERLLHLCFLDRLAFALGTRHRARFLADMASLTPDGAPRIYQRSAAAWDSHPRNYREIEGFVTAVGQLLFGRALDYAWCHVAFTAAQLEQALSGVRNHDLSMVAELILPFRETIHIQEVDWLAWEDPFVLGRDPAALRAEREASAAETGKRLAYALPMAAALQRFAMELEK